MGEHTAEILAELGFARHEIAALATRGTTKRAGAHERLAMRDL